MDTHVYQRAVHVDHSTGEPPAKGPAQRCRCAELIVPGFGAHRGTALFQTSGPSRKDSSPDKCVW